MRAGAGFLASEIPTLSDRGAIKAGGTNGFDSSEACCLHEGQENLSRYGAAFSAGPGGHQAGGVLWKLPGQDLVGNLEAAAGFQDPADLA